MNKLCVLFSALLLTAGGVVAQEWERSYVNEAFSEANDLAYVQFDKGLVIAGGAGLHCELPRVFKYSETGDLLWETSLQGADAIHVRPGGDVLIAGTDMFVDDVFSQGYLTLTHLDLFGNVLTMDTLRYLDGTVEPYFSLKANSVWSVSTSEVIVATPNRVWITGAGGSLDAEIPLVGYGELRQAERITFDRIAVAADSALLIINDAGAVIAQRDFSQPIEAGDLNGDNFIISLDKEIKIIDTSMTTLDSLDVSASFSRIDDLQFQNGDIWLKGLHNNQTEVRVGEYSPGLNSLQQFDIALDRIAENALFAAGEDYYYLSHERLWQAALSQYDATTLNLATADVGLTLGAVNITNVVQTNFGNGVGYYNHDADVEVVNNGQTTINDFNLYYRTEGFNCGSNGVYQAYTNQNIAPGQSKTVSMSGMSSGAPMNGDIYVCMTVKGPDFTIELNVDDNDTCLFFSGYTSVAEAEMEVAKLSLFPNPVEDQLTFQLDAAQGQAAYTILDLQGRVVKQGMGNRGMVPVQDLAPGMYVFRLQLADLLINRQFVKQ